MENVGGRNADFLVLGAGIIGLAVAKRLRTLFADASIIILEKESAAGCHASGRNSGVLHSGIYYGPGTLKARVCAAGAAAMRAFAEEHGIACRQDGKIIVATEEAERPAVDKLLANAQANGIEAVRLDDAGIRAIEPNARSCGAGIYCPTTAVIDSPAVVRKLQELLRTDGVEFRFGEPVRKVLPLRRQVTTPQGVYSYGHVFNCTGAYADRLAAPFGVGLDYTLVPFKGLYYKLRVERSHLVNANIYPVPDIALPFLGVHLTRVINGDVYVGPTAIPALGRENYGVLKGMRVSETPAIGWQLARLYGRNADNFRTLVHAELKKYRKRHFLTAAKKLMPILEWDDLVPTNKVGIRPQLVNTRTRRLEMDYVIERTDHSTHVLNSISPAFTSAFAFTEVLLEKFEPA